MFGHASLLSEWPTALAVRAAEDSLLYRLPAEAIRPVLARPAALRFAARSLAGRYEMLQRELDPLAIAVVDPARRPVSRLLRGRPGDRRSRRDGAGGRPPHGRGQLVGRAGRSRRRIRHRHRPRPARARGGRRGTCRHPRVAGDDRPGHHHRRRRHRRRRAAGHARPRRPPPAGGGRVRPRDRRHLRHRPDGGGDAHPVPPAQGDHGGDHRRRAGGRRGAAARTRSSACTTPRLPPPPSRA